MKKGKRNREKKRKRQYQQVVYKITFLSIFLYCRKIVSLSICIMQAAVFAKKEITEKEWKNTTDLCFSVLLERGFTTSLSSQKIVSLSLSRKRSSTLSALAHRDDDKTGVRSRRPIEQIIDDVLLSRDEQIELVHQNSPFSRPSSPSSVDEAAFIDFKSDKANR